MSEGIIPYLIIHCILTLGMKIACDYSYPSWEGNSKRRFNSTSKFVLTVLFIIYIIFSAYREIDAGIGGIDAPFYKAEFEQMPNLSLLSYIASSREEAAYTLLIWVVRRFTCDFKYVLIIVHSIVFVCFTIFIKNTYQKEHDIKNILYIFVQLGTLFTMFCLIRQGIAIGLCLIYFNKIEQKEYKNAAIFLVLAILFHNSAIILIPSLYLSWYMSRNKIVNVKSFIPIILFLMVGEYCLTGLMIKIFSNTAYSVYDNSAGIALGTYLIIIICLAFTVLLNRKSEQSFSIDCYQLILMTSLLCIPIQLVYSIAYRMVLIYIPVVYVVLNNATHNYNLKLKDDKVSHFLLIILAYAYYIYRGFTIYSSDLPSAGLETYKSLLF